jgi:hypothetical protein
MSGEDNNWWDELCEDTWEMILNSQELQILEVEANKKHKKTQWNSLFSHND